MWPRSDINKRNDASELTQTRSCVFRGAHLGNDPEDDLGATGRTILVVVPRLPEKWAHPHMDAITRLASRPNSMNEIAHPVAELDSPPTVAEISDVVRAIGDGDVHIIEKGHRTNLRRTKHVISRRLRTKE
jgi:hypothetical protein